MSRMYTTKSGKEVPSVTTILKVLHTPGINEWANYLGFKHKNYITELEKYADAGTLNHSYVEHIIKSGSLEGFEFPDQFTKIKCEKIGTKFKEKMAEYEHTSLEVELSLVSDTLGYGGTLDWYLIIEGSYALLDFKSSKKVRDKHLLQLGGYYNLLKEHGYQCNLGGIMLLHEEKSLIYPIDEDALIRLGKIFNLIKRLYDVMSYVDISKLSQDIKTICTPF